MLAPSAVEQTTVTFNMQEGKWKKTKKKNVEGIAKSGFPAMHVQTGAAILSINVWHDKTVVQFVPISPHFHPTV